MRPDRTPEEQAELDREAAFWAKAAEDERRRMIDAAAAFVTPKFSRKDVAAALQAREVMFQNWQARDQIDLDADQARDGAKWRLYSARDVLRLGLAVKLSDLGFPASLFRRVMGQIETLLSQPSVYIASNRPCHIVVLSDGTVIGPELGEMIDVGQVPSGHFLLIRMDQLVREALEPLGYSITFGNADDMRETVDRLERGRT